MELVQRIADSVAASTRQCYIRSLHTDLCNQGSTQGTGPRTVRHRQRNY